jgi:hypothetical protein
VDDSEIMGERACPHCRTMNHLAVVRCRHCGTTLVTSLALPLARRGGSVLRRALVVIGIVFGALVIIGAIGSTRHKRSRAGASAAQEPSQPKAASCAGVAERQAWISSESGELSGYSPKLFGMSATGVCSDDLRVREKDCSVRYLVEAYGHKPFMQTAQRLGFRTFSCGFDVFDMPVITGQQ